MKNKPINNDPMSEREYRELEMKVYAELQERAEADYDTLTIRDL